MAGATGDQESAPQVDHRAPGISGAAEEQGPALMILICNGIRDLS
jgi:hypothetical protein